MKVIEIILGIFFLIGIILKSTLVLGGSALVVLSGGCLAYLYVFLSFLLLNNIRFRKAFKKESYQGIKGIQVIQSIFGGFALSSLILGLVYGLQLYPGRLTMLMIGLVSVSVYAILLFFQKNKEKRQWIRISVMGFIGILFLIIPGESLIDVFYRHRPTYAQARKELLHDPENVQIIKRLHEIEKKDWRKEKEKYKKKR